ncbi:MAG: restriction endonuclease subunit S, partial [Candidatus Fonsibacter sp.]
MCAQDGSIGATHYYSGKFWGSNHIWCLKSNTITNIQYIYNIMKYYIDYKPLTSGNAIPKLTKNKIENIEIPVPPLSI